MADENRLAPQPPIDTERSSSESPTVTGTPSRQRGGIPFPYDDLDAGISIARALHDTFGGHAESEQVAAALGQNPSSGSFTAKLGAARHFGLVTTRKRTVEATPLGQRILNEQAATAARVEAFLNVPLYAALYEAYNGTQLPGDAGLEAKIRSLGAPEKQVKTARQVFARSARQAGFFDLSPDRLVKPAVTSMKSEEASDDEETFESERRKDDIGMKPAIITEVFRRLPDEGESFPPDARERWMAALTASLDLEYATEAAPRRRQAPEDDIAITRVHTVASGS